MKRKSFPVNFYNSIVMLVLLFGMLIPTKFAVTAQASGCYWKLASEEPLEITASTAPSASSSVSGTTVTINWEGLTTTHSWSYPGSILIPGEELFMEVNVSWEISSGEALNSTGGLRTTFYFGVNNISASRSSISFNAEKSGSANNSTNFVIPTGSKEGATFSIYGYADAAVAGGRVDYSYTYVCPTPTPSATKSETKTSTISTTPTITPTACPADTPEKRLAEILDLYSSRIPNGITSSGEKNNILDFFGYPGYAEYTCGGYQSKVLDFLNNLKFSKNPCEAQLLDSWDYGPIHAWFGYHQAVVIYPKGTDWKQTGLVLDPWPKQTPKVYNVTDWAVMFSAAGYNPGEQLLGPTFIGIDPSEEYRDGKAYPLLGGSYQDPSNKTATVTFSEVEYQYIHSLPPDKLEAFKKMPKPDQKHWLKIAMEGGEKTQKSIAHCPLNLYILGVDGRRSGVVGKQILYELPDVFFMSLRLEDGTNYTEIIYPEKTEYTLIFDGVGEGQAYVLNGYTFLLGEQNSSINLYNFSVEQGMSYLLPTSSTSGVLNWETGSILPEKITEVSEEWLNQLSTLMEIREGEQVNSSTERDAGILSDLLQVLKQIELPLWLGILLLLLAVGLFVLFIILLVWLLFKKKGNSVLADRRPGWKSKRFIVWILSIILLIFSCLVASIGGFALYTQIKTSDINSNDLTLELTMTSLAYEQTSLSLLMTEAINPISTPTMFPPGATGFASLPPTQPALADEINTITPPSTFTQTEIFIPSQTGQGLSIGQYLDDHSLVDDFSSKNLGWPELDDGRKILKYEQGGYGFQLKEKESFDIVYLPISFNPSEIIFDVMGQEGDQDGTFGIFCQLQDIYNYYYVEFDLQTGKYVIAQSLNGEYIPLTEVAPEGQYWHKADALRSASLTNHISIGCYLGSISIMINDQFVDDVFIEAPFNEKGKTALFVYVYSFAGDEGYKVIFDNLEAYEPMQ